MKHLHKIFTTFCLSAALFSCSKKVHTFQFGQPYYQNPVSADNRVKQDISPEKTGIAEASVVEKATLTTPEAIQVATALKDASKTAPTKNDAPEKLTFKQKLAKKVAAKIKKQNEKIQKQTGKTGVTGNLRIGIIVAGIGLLVLIIAGIGGFGGASGVFWILGAIALLIGLIIILLELV